VADIVGATVVLGRRGLTRDVVRHALETVGVTTVDLVAFGDDPAVPIVAVLVNPSDEDWAESKRMGARIVLVGDGEPGPEAAVDALVRGADAVLGSDIEIDELVEVIATVAAGMPYVSPAQAAEALDRLRRGPAAAPELPALTPREIDILASIERGDAVKQTARLLQISEKTVQNIQSRLFRKVGARNRAQAVAKAHELGLLVDNTVAEPE
jgi:DNA-binding NarL/FixJ family response regulator